MGADNINKDMGWLESKIKNVHTMITLGVVIVGGIAATIHQWDKVDTLNTEHEETVKELKALRAAVYELKMDSCVYRYGGEAEAMSKCLKEAIE